MTKRHRELIQHLSARGWQCVMFRERLHAALKDPRWWNDGDPVDPSESGDEPYGSMSCLVEEVQETCCRPDAFRFVVEGVEHGWGHDVLVVEIMEVSVTHHLKRSKWERFWWLADASEAVACRVFEMNDAGEVTPFLVEENAVDQLEKRLIAEGTLEEMPAV